MPWVSAAASIGGALIGASATRSAAKKQADAAAAALASQERAAKEAISRQQIAADAAIGLQRPASEAAIAENRAATEAAMGLQRGQFDRTSEANRLRTLLGDTAISRLQGLQDFRGPTNEEVMAEPGYAFGLQQGLGNIENTAAAKGGLYSGNALKALTRYGSDYATGRFNEAYNRRKGEADTQWSRLQALAGIGERGQSAVQSAGSEFATNAGNLGVGSANRIGDIGTQTATNIGNIGLQGAGAAGTIGMNTAQRAGDISMNNATAQGAAGLAQANIWGNAANQVGAGIIDYNRRNPAPVSTPVAQPGYYARPGESNYLDVNPMADGGPVLHEGSALDRQLERWEAFADGGPVLQPGSPPPAGGVDRTAILEALNASAENPQRNGALPYARGGQVRRRNYMHGGGVDGPGGPRDDMIPASLSDGEHVFDTRSVNAFGGGDNARGQHGLNVLRMLLKSRA